VGNNLRTGTEMRRIRSSQLIKSLPGNGRFFPNRDVTWLQPSCTTTCNRFLHSRGGYVGSIIRRYRILGRITHLSDTLPTLTEDNRASAGITFEDTDLPVESLSRRPRRWGVHRPRSRQRSLIPVWYPGLGPEIESVARISWFFRSRTAGVSIREHALDHGHENACN